MLEEAGVTISPARWLVRVAGRDAFVLAFDGHHWALTRGDTEDADVTITTTRPALARFLTSLPEARDTEQPDLTIAGSHQAVSALLEAIAVFPSAPGSRRPLAVSSA
jgi:hypothetical protein